VKVWAWRPEASAISTLAGKPSKARPTDGLAVVGVLPFENQSASREDGYFSDGMTEDLINALSRQTVFRVLGRHSTFCFRDRNDDIRLIARELDANYIVRGSVRRAAKKVRVTAELLAPETGEQLWSERCDRDIDDIFAIQDEITTGLAACITPEISRAETQIRARLTDAELSAWDCFMKGLWHYYAASNDDLLQAAVWFRRASENDPTLATSKAWLAITFRDPLESVSFDSTDRAATFGGHRTRRNAATTKRRPNKDTAHDLPIAGHNGRRLQSRPLRHARFTWSGRPASCTSPNPNSRSCD
jgi:adenylate cyclase